MANDLNALNSLIANLNSFGSDQRNQAVQTQQSQRADQELALQKLANQRAQSQFEFGTQQARQQAAIRQFGSDVQIEAKVNPYLANLLSTASSDPTGSQMAQLLASNPDLKSAAQKVYQKYDKTTKSYLGPSFQSIYGGQGMPTTSNVSSSPDTGGNGYTIPPQSRFGDALDAAGSFLENNDYGFTDVKNLNNFLFQPPTISENPSPTPGPYEEGGLMSQTIPYALQELAKKRQQEALQSVLPQLMPSPK